MSKIISVKKAQSANPPSSNSGESKPRSFLIPPGLVSPSSDKFSEIFEQINSTGTLIQGTIDGLSTSITNIHTYTVGNERISNLEDRQKSIDNEIESIKIELLPQLEKSKTSLNQIEEFLRNNATFISNSIMVEGKLKSLEGEISSLTRRVEFVEGKKNINWNKSAIVITIIISVISIGIALFAVFKP